MQKRYEIQKLVLVSLLLTFSLFSNITGQNSTYSVSYKDGPYLFYKGDSLKIATIRQTADGEMNLYYDSCGAGEIKNKVFQVKPNSVNRSFSFQVFDYLPDPAIFSKPDKIVVVSDIEGNFKDFTAILKAAKVIDKKYNWIFGKNHLILNGDLFDRGTDVSAVLWFCYKLDRESVLQGGKVHITIGNHEAMNLQGDTRYVQPEYLAVAKAMGIEYPKLFDENTEIGRWLRTKNCITIIDSTLFVHGGISPELIKLGLNSDEINKLTRESLGKKRSELTGISKFMMGESGPIWYRGLVFNVEKFHPVNPEDLKEILSHFGVQRIVIGHSIVDEIVGLHEGKVIAADVDHPENRKSKKSRALLISNNQVFTINDRGKLSEMPVLKGFVEINKDEEYK